MPDLEQLCCGNTCCKNAKTPLMPGSGNQKAEIMILGEAPGQDEDEEGTPFVGKAGHFLKRRIMPAAGLDVSDVYFTNTVRCYPGRSKDGKKNKNPLANDIRRCRSNLVDEVKKVRPNVVIAMGNVALHGCLELSRWRDDEGKKDTAVTGIMKWRGKRVWHPEFNCWIVFALHPSFLMRKYKFEKYEFDLTVKDFELAMRTARKDKMPKSKCSIALLNDKKLAADYLRLVLENADEVAVDTETSTMDYREMSNSDPKEVLLGVSLATDYTLMEIKGKRFEAVFIPSRILYKMNVLLNFQELLKRKTICKVWHNSGFDERVLSTLGWGFGNVDEYNHICTMMAAKLVDENFSVGLKELTWRYLSFGGYEKSLDDYRRENNVSSFKDVPTKMLAKYAALDVVATIRLWKYVLRPSLGEVKLLNFFLNVAVKARMVFTSFELCGMQADAKRAKALSKKCDEVRDKLVKRLYKVAGEEFNIRSYPQMRAILFGKLGAKPVKETKTNLPATDSESMKKLLSLPKNTKRARLFIQIKMDIDYINKQKSTYIDRIGKIVWDDGRVRVNYNLTGTVTGRPSSSLSNIPKDGLIRSLFTASEGNVLLECDMAAAELRVLAAYCKEPVMLDAFRNGEDLHEATYRAIFGKPKDYVVQKKERDIGKRINFGSVYGISAAGLAAKFGVPESEAERFLELYFKNLPGVGQWLEDNAKFGQQHGYVISFFNRKRRLPELRSDSRRDKSRAVRQAGNAVIQSCASDLCYVGMVRAYYLMKRHGVKARIVNSVYDSVIIELPESEVGIMKKILKKSFETPVKGLPDFLMEVDFKVSKSWGKDYPSKLAEVLLMKPASERKAS